MKAILLLALLMLSLITVLMVHAAEGASSFVATRHYNGACTACRHEVNIIPSLILF